jgi:hypothetical protein
MAYSNKGRPEGRNKYPPHPHISSSPNIATELTPAILSQVAGVVPLSPQFGLDFLDGHVSGDMGAVGGGPNLLEPRLHHKGCESWLSREASGLKWD